MSWSDVAYPRGMGSKNRLLYTSRAWRHDKPSSPGSVPWSVFPRREPRYAAERTPVERAGEDCCYKMVVEF